MLATSNFELDRSLPNVKNNKVIGLMKDESGGAIEDKKSKRHNKVCHKKSLSLRIMKTV